MSVTETQPVSSACVPLRRAVLLAEVAPRPMIVNPQSMTRPLRWLCSAITGAMVGAAIPLLLSLLALATTDSPESPEFQLGFGLAFLLVPLGFIAGLIGGVVVESYRRTMGRTTHEPRTNGWWRAIWFIAGGIAGCAASTLTLDESQFNAEMYGELLIPIWAWLGAMFAINVCDTRRQSRPLLGSLVAIGASYPLFRLMVWLKAPTTATPPHSPAALGASIVVGLIIYYQLHRSTTKSAASLQVE